MPTVRHDMVGVWVIRRVGEMWQHLQLLRAPDDYMGNTWSLCRGGIEPGETAVAAALRELQEETGLTPTELYRLGTLEQFYVSEGDTVWVAPFFAALVDPAAPVILNAEHTASRWTFDAQMDDAIVWPSEEHLLREVRRFVLSDHPTKRLMRVVLPTTADR